jgi:hypothetical protein
MVAYILEQHEKAESPTAPSALLDGNDLMDSLKLRQGPLIGKLLEAIREARAAGEVSLREEALSLARWLLAHPEDMAADSKTRGNDD